MTPHADFIFQERRQIACERTRRRILYFPQPPRKESHLWLVLGFLILGGLLAFALFGLAFPVGALGMAGGLWDPVERKQARVELVSQAKWDFGVTVAIAIVSVLIAYGVGAITGWF